MPSFKHARPSLQAQNIQGSSCVDGQPCTTTRAASQHAHMGRQPCTHKVMQASTPRPKLSSMPLGHPHPACMPSHERLVCGHDQHTLDATHTRKHTQVSPKARPHLARSRPLHGPTARPTYTTHIAGPIARPYTSPKHAHIGPKPPSHRLSRQPSPRLKITPTRHVHDPHTCLHTARHSPEACPGAESRQPIKPGQARPKNTPGLACLGTPARPHGRASPAKARPRNAHKAVARPAKARSRHAQPIEGTPSQAKARHAHTA